MIFFFDPYVDIFGELATLLGCYHVSTDESYWHSGGSTLLFQNDVNSTSWQSITSESPEFLLQQVQLFLYNVPVSFHMLFFKEKDPAWIEFCT